MSRDGKRIVALVLAVEALAKGEPQTLGELAESVFGWSTSRVFDAIDSALHAGQIARNDSGQIVGGAS